MKLALRDALYGILFVAILVIGCSMGGGGTATPPPAQSGEAQEVDALIDRFQTAYSAKDYEGIRACFHPKANVAIDFGGGVNQSTYHINEWMDVTKEVLSKHGAVSDVLSNREIVVYRNLATVVADYNFRAGAMHQAGQDIMICTKFNGEWKIFSLTFYGDNA